MRLTANLVKPVKSFSPTKLFNNAEPGVWYDPSGLTTLFQDSAGTTPVTAPGQPVGLILDKSKGLGLGPELVTNGGFDSGSAGWLANSVAVVGWDAGRLSVQRVSSAADVAYQAIATVVGKTYRFSFDAAGEQSAARVAVGTGAAFLSPLAVISAPGGVFTATTTTTFIGFGAYGNGRTAFYDNISVRELPGHHATQATAAARPTYQVDGSGRGYLSFDGVDDWLVTPTITPGIDKVQIFAGVRKLSDAAIGAVVELSASSIVGNGSFTLLAPDSPHAYSFCSRGTTRTFASAVGSFAAPITNVLTGVGDIAGDSAILRVNGTQVASSTADQGAGNFLAYPLYIGRRGGTSLPFNGRIYGLIVRFGANLTADQITKTEAWVNKKTGAY